MSGIGARAAGLDPIHVVRRVWSVLAGPLAAIVLALLVGAVGIVIFSGYLPGRPAFDVRLPLDAYSALWDGSVGSPNAITRSLVFAAPLMLAGLGVGLGFKAGLFNVGGTGQFLLGALGAVWVGVLFRNGNPWIGIPLALLAGAAAGAFWGFIPGILKATSGAHEVVTTIMLNYVAVNVLAWAIVGPLSLPGAPQPETNDVGNTALPIILGRDAHLGVAIAFLAVPLVWFLLYRTTLGFEIRTAGANPDAARYAGMRPRWLITLTMTLSGLFVGLAGAGNVLGINHQIASTFSTTVGFDAITVALLGRSNPFGAMFAALLLGGMRAGSQSMQIQAGVPSELVDVLEAIILVFLVVNVLRRFLKARGVRGTEMAGIETVTRTYGRESV